MSHQQEGGNSSMHSTKQSNAFANSYDFQIELEDFKSSSNVTPPPTLVASSNAKDKSHHDKDDGDHSEAHDCLHSKIGYSIKELILVSVWFVLVGIYIWYLVEVFITIDDQVKHPTTSVTYVEQVPKKLPQVTICNWNSGYYCGESCNLTLVGCSMVNEDGYAYNCEATAHEPKYIQYEQHGNIFNCYQYNFDEHDPVKISTTGYEGSISLYFKVPSMEISDYNRNGLQVTFNKIGEIPDVYDETNYCLTNVDNFFTLTHVETKQLNSAEPEERWEINYSKVYLANNMTVVSFCYSTLNLNDITEVEYTTGPDILAKICEMLLILVGIDFIKIVRGVLLIPEAIKHKTIKEIFETFI